MKERKLDAVRCATCNQPTALIRVNGRDVMVNPVAHVAAGSIFIFELHDCGKATSPASSPATSSTTRSSNGKGVRS